VTVFGIGLLVVAAVAVIVVHGGGPTELSPDVWDADHAKRARNLALARAAWKAGKPFVNPAAYDRAGPGAANSDARGPMPPVANPNATGSDPKRWVRHGLRHYLE
jgi:hypothetical protein